MQASTGKPLRIYRISQQVCFSETTTIDTICAYKIRVAEAADCIKAILLATAPQIATGKAAEHRRAPGLCALALQGMEDFFDAVAHG
jgi:creatinine amidohydrolase/Fe(II)-dependent formamide hydrolase-like protein